MKLKSQQTRQITIFLFFINFLFFTSVSAATYYVSTTGNDNGAGSMSNPWKTIQKAANVMVAGDTVLIRGGVYMGQVIVSTSGASGAYITYKNYNGEEVIIDGGMTHFTEGHTALFYIKRASYIKAIGINVKNIGDGVYDNSYDQSGFIAEFTHHITIKDCSTYNTFSSGIFITDSHDIIIDNNTIKLACNGGENECISMQRSFKFEIKNNKVSDGSRIPLANLHGGEGIDVKQGSHDGSIHHNSVSDLPSKLGIYVDSYKEHTYNIDVYQNIVHDCIGGFALSSEWGGVLENIKLYNNIAYHNSYYGFNITSWDEALTNVHPMKDISIINNTAYNNKWNGQNWGGGIIIANKDGQNIIVRNNICSQNIEQIFLPEALNLNQVKVDHNLIDGPQSSTNFGTDFIIGDPKFTDASNAKFELELGSLAIDAGSPDAAPHNDYKGGARPAGATYDIGAYEYGATLALTNYKDTNLLVYPIPTKDILYIENFDKTELKATIFDSNGKEVLHKILKSNKNSFSVKSLSKGIYFLKIESPTINKAKNIKFIVN